MRRRPTLTGLLILVLVVIGWWGVHRAARQSLDRGIARFTASLPRGATLTYRKASPILLLRGADFRDVTYHDGPVTLSIGRLTIAGFSGYPLQGLHARHVVARNVRYVDDTRGITLADADLHRLFVPAGERIAPLVPKITLRDATVNRLAAHARDVPDATIRRLILHDYAAGKDSDLTLQDAAFQLQPGSALPDGATAPEAIAGRVAVFHVHGLDLATYDDRLLHQEGLIAGPAPQDDPAAHHEMSSSLENLHVTTHAGAVTIGRVDTATTITGPKTGQHVMMHGIAIPSLPQELPGKPADVEFDVGFDRAHGTASIANAHVTIPQAATLTLALSADHANAGHPAPGELRLVSASLNYRDAGMIDAVMAFISHKYHLDPTQLRAMLAQRGQLMQVIAPPLGTISTYLSQPGDRTLTVGLAPSTPLSFGMLRSLRQTSSPLEQIRLLGLTAAIR